MLTNQIKAGYGIAIYTPTSFAGLFTGRFRQTRQMKRVIAIGTGGIGRRHIRGLIRTGRAALTLIEPHEERRVAAQREYAPEAAFARLEQADLASHDLPFIATSGNLRLDHSTLSRADAVGADVVALARYSDEAVAAFGDL